MSSAISCDERSQNLSRAKSFFSSFIRISFEIHGNGKEELGHILF
jgi:hypothetical protein